MEKGLVIALDITFGKGFGNWNITAGQALKFWLSLASGIPDRGSDMRSGKGWSKLPAWIRQQFGQSFVNQFRQELEHWSRSKIWAQGFGNWNISRVVAGLRQRFEQRFIKVLYKGSNPLG